MSEQILYFNVFSNNPTINIIECISWIIKYFLLLMHGVTLKKSIVYVSIILTTLSAVTLIKPGGTHQASEHVLNLLP